MLVAHEHPGLDTTEESTMSFFFAACLGDKQQLSQLFPLHMLCVFEVFKSDFLQVQDLLATTFFKGKPCVISFNCP
jgi:hypothetical protein